MIRPAPRTVAAGLALAAGAMAVRGAWLPLERHVFDGHEADYLAAFQGAAWSGSTRLYPVLAGAYAALGQLSSDPRLLLAVNLLAGALTAVAGAAWARRRWSPRAGWVLGALLALSPAHVFWSASAYNVAIPQGLVVLGLALGGWRGAVAFALACTMRLELALVAPALALLGAPRVAVGALGAGLAWPLLDHTAALHPWHRVWAPNLQLTAYLGPLGTAWGLPLIALACTRRSWRLVAAALWVHLTACAFDDYGFRHALFGGFALAAVVAVATGWRAWLAVPALVLLGLGTHDVAERYYLPQAAWEAEVPQLPAPPPCHEVLDDPLSPATHWSARRSPPDGPACWGEERIHRAWTSRALHARALRMHRLYDLEPIGVLRLPGGSRLVYGVGW